LEVGFECPALLNLRDQLKPVAPGIDQSTSLDSRAVRSAEVNAAIDDIAPEFIIQIPSSTLTHILEHCEKRTGSRYFPVAREEEGVGIATGLVLAGRRVLMIMQDNGLGNSLTAFTTLPLPYHVPLLVLVSRRGGLGEYNSMIHSFCEKVEAITDAAGLRHFDLDGRTPVEEWRSTIVRASAYSTTTHRPVFVFMNLMGG
jgi:sulfopyruvate decarboxylase subunit alpha